jgi:chromosome segregation ATPase
MFLLCGCATSSNPAEGGFFSGVHGLTSGEYQNRVNQKQGSLEQLQENGSQLRSQQENLSQQSAALTSQEKSYRRKLSRMNHDLKRMQARLRKARVKTQSGQVQKVKLEKNLNDLQVRIRVREHQTGLTEDQLQQQLAGLNQEKSRLEHQILKLTSQ